MAITLATITLPADLEWTDEFDWLPTSQQVDVAMSGALIAEESAQLAGRPITLEGRLDGSIGFALIPRSTVSALVALASTPRATPMSLLLEDGRTFDVLFRHGQDGPAVEAHAMKHIAPHVDDDLYTITLRLMQV